MAQVFEWGKTMSFWKRLMEYRYWRRRGYSRARAWETARNTF